MGLDKSTEWKKQLSKKIPVLKWLQKEQAERAKKESANFVVIDLTLAFHVITMARGLTNWKSLDDRFNRMIDWVVKDGFPSAEVIVFVIDESGRTPPVKGLPSRLSGSNAKQEARCHCLDKEDLEFLGPSAYLCSSKRMDQETIKRFYEERKKRFLGNDQGDEDAEAVPASVSKPLTPYETFIQLYVRTDDLRFDMSRYITLTLSERIAFINKNKQLRKGLEIILDGAVCKPLAVDQDWRDNLRGIWPAVHLEQAIESWNTGITASSFDDMDDRRAEAEALRNMQKGLDVEHKRVSFQIECPCQGGECDFQQAVHWPIAIKEEPSWPSAPDQTDRSLVLRLGGIGEADIKIASYIESFLSKNLLRQGPNHAPQPPPQQDRGSLIRFCSNQTDTRPKSIWVCMKDTDIIPISLMICDTALKKKKALLESRDQQESTKKDRNKLRSSSSSSSSSSYDDDQEKKKGSLFSSSLHHVYIDVSPDSLSSRVKSKKDSSQVFDALDAVDQIHSYFNQNYACVSNPVITLCALMIMTGTDFVNPIPHLGLAKILNTFDAYHNASSNPCYRVLADALTISPENGHILFVEKSLCDFIRMAYTSPSLLKGSKKKDVKKKPDQHDETCPDVFSSYQDIEEKILRFTKRASPERHAFTQGALCAWTRRVVWNLIYWTSGSTPTCPYPVATINGRAIFGWVYQSDDSDPPGSPAVPWSSATKKRRGGGPAIVEAVEVYQTP